jgi:NAD(P)-dependent dehydrogenase (short-subunit alcohol dehydrogenase family)
MKKLQKKVAVLTGATTGIGLSTARLFAREGAYVFITGRRQKELDEAVKSIGENAAGVLADSADFDDLDRLFETVKSSKRKIDILFISAGVIQGAPLGGITEEQFDKQFNVNVKGTLFTVQKALPLINDGGSIIMIGSAVVHMGLPYLSVYTASKAALEAFAKGWVSDLKTRGIRVNVIHPGPIDTPLFQSMPEEQKKASISGVPMGRAGRPDEIATAALFLASADSSFITGTAITVDGGSTVQV